MTDSVRASTVQTTQTTQTQQTTAPKQKEIDRKSMAVGAEKMYRAADTVTSTASAVGRATIGFLKAVTNKVGIAKDKATDTIGQKNSDQKPEVQTETRASKAEARKSQNVFISFIDKNAKFNEVMDNSNASNEDKAKALKEFSNAYDKLSPKDKEAYRSEMSDAMGKAITSDSKIDNIMKETLSTEKSFLRNLENINQGLAMIEKKGNIPKNELDRMKNENKVLEMEVKKNIAALETAMKGSDGEKLLTLKEHISLNKDTAFGKAIENATVNYTKNTALIAKSGNDEAKNLMRDSVIAPAQRGPRYVMLVADLAKKHSDLGFKNLASDLQTQIASNMTRINAQIPKTEVPPKK